MSQPPYGDPNWTPPPPPSGGPQWTPPPPPGSDSPFDPRVLADKTEYVNKNAIYALIFALSGFLCCGLLSIFAFRLSSSVIETIDYYDVARDKRGIAMAAKVISIIAIALWILGVIFRIVMR